MAAVCWGLPARHSAADTDHRLPELEAEGSRGRVVCSTSPQGHGLQAEQQNHITQAETTGWGENVHLRRGTVDGPMLDIALLGTVQPSENSFADRIVSQGEYSGWRC
ncbi:hypothetical protein J4Q44_G00319330 [Coregonus suidteri]|uniref:Uncharacterized protein n=1 Tax=Coregonus suidteri TaxID=861788 RepID=A0AAN8QA87_9TELE